MPGNTASVSYGGHGHYSVRIGAADIGTGSWTALTQIAADALGMPFDHVHLEIGDTLLPKATVEGGSAGLASHGSAVLLAAQRFRAEHGVAPEAGATTEATTEPPGEQEYATHSYGAQFVEARVNVDTGEVRVPRMVGVFSVRPDRQPAHRPLPADRRHGVGALDGAAREVGGRPRARPRGHPRPRGVPRPLARRHRRHRRDLARRGGPARERAGRQGDRRDRHHRHRGCGDQRVYNATGIRVRDLPVTPDRLLR